MAMARNTRGKVVPLHEDHVVDAFGPALETADALRFGPPHPFPIVSTLPRLPVMIADEILDYYGWVFCQGGFLNLQMTLEQFLAVVAAVSPAGLSPEYDASEASYPND